MGLLPGGRALYRGKDSYGAQAFENDTRLGLAQLGAQITALAASTAAALAAGLAAISSAVIYGVTNGSNATAGYVGEYVESVVAPTAIGGWVTSTPQTITSISLTPGDWDVSGMTMWPGGPTSQRTIAYIGLLGPNATGAFGDTGHVVLAVGPGTYSCTLSVPPQRISLTVTTTVYLGGLINFTAGAPTAGGYLRARRVR